MERKKSAKPNPNCVKNERGSVMIIGAFFMMTMLFLAALPVDYSYLSMVNGQLQTAADAAALAGAAQLSVSSTAAQQAGMAYLNNNTVAGHALAGTDAQVHLGRYDFVTKTFIPDALPFNAVQAVAQRTKGSTSGPLKLFFSSLFGHGEANLARSAVAVVDPEVVGVKASHHLLPYTVDRSLLDENHDGAYDYGHKIRIYFQKNEGNFGFVGIAGEDASGGNLKDSIKYGVDGDFVFPNSGVLVMTGVPGLHGNSLNDAFNYITDKNGNGPTVNILAHSGVTIDSSNATAVYTIKDILAAHVTGYKLTGALDSRYIELKIDRSSSSSYITRDGAPENAGLTKLRLTQ